MQMIQCNALALLRAVCQKSSDFSSIKTWSVSFGSAGCFVVLIVMIYKIMCTARAFAVSLIKCLKTNVKYVMNIATLPSLEIWGMIMEYHYHHHH